MFPPPVGTPEAMSRLEKLSESQLLPTFNERTKEFCAHILQNSNAKAIGGHVLNGPSELNFYVGFYGILQSVNCF